ncbi:hypothetical protein SELMODRAFT_404582 [Selaginella moellendorffii]|uniref:Uncharacterized protein n=1 Tax=Selaginella moellendorffii TaxID=88036 RepID=D8QVS4_SELML|nr:hypothetical protein SELMODRAFT_404577 [Selaginella moellendorffii]EFJ36510.1 hypothetical protein SELMODRAFT_404582 [Selaginella moellendorffii]
MDRFVSAQEGLPLKWASSFRQTNCSEGGGKFLKLAGVTGSATALSKVLGLVRELVLAAVFGVGPVVDAFGNQWTNPHSNGIGLKIPLSLGILMYTLAAFLIDAITTGLLLKTSSGLITRSMAILQPNFGMGFVCSVSGRYGIASLSPALSSISIILAIFAQDDRGIKLCMLLMTGLAIPLAKPIVRALVQCYTFGDSAAQAVSLLVKHYCRKYVSTQLSEELSWIKVEKELLHLREIQAGGKSKLVKADFPFVIQFKTLDLRAGLT